MHNRSVFIMAEDCDRYTAPALISGLKEQLASLRYEIRAFSTGGSVKTSADILAQVMEERPAALIIEPEHDLIPDPNQRLIDGITDMGIPVVYCNSPMGPIHVVPDNAEGGRLLTKNLLSSGSKKTACIFRMDSSAGRDRYQGYIDALTDLGAGFDEALCLLLTHEDEKEIISGRGQKLSTFIDDNLRECDAVICQNGMIAHQLVRALSGRGISVPHDITVACFDSGYYAADGIISLGYDNESFCRALAKTAVALAEGRNAASIMVPMHDIPKTFSS
jgi:GntR family transcriptional regulator of arabinose operon